MGIPTILRRILTYAVIGTTCLCLTSIVLIQIQQRIFRSRAERLVADVRSLKLGKTGLAEAKAMLSRWNRWEGSQDTCDDADCSFRIALNNFEWDPANVLQKPWVVQAYMLAGGRPAVVRAQVSAKNGIIATEGVDVAFRARDGWRRSYDVFTGFAGWNKNSGVDDLAPGPEHYRAHQAANCWPCVLVDFTSEAQESDLERLLVFDFSCLTRLSVCRGARELMPSAWSDLAARQDKSCAEDAEAEIQRSRNIGIVDVLTIGTGPREEYATVRLGKLLRGATSAFHEGGEYNANLSAPANAHPLGPGSKLILLFTNLSAGPGDYLTPMSCGTMDLNDSNLELVRRNLDSYPSGAERTLRP